MTDIIDQTVDDIKKLRIQGATEIAKKSLVAIGKWAESKSSLTNNNLESKAFKLKNARPTEPLTGNCLNLFLYKVKHEKQYNYIKIAQDILTMIETAHEKIVGIGVGLIKNGQTILTHCHSSTVVAILSNAAKKGIQFKTILTETRPKYQGHITAEQLLKQKIDTTLITDSQASFIISRQDNQEVDLIIVGADAIDNEGNALNKVGSYGLSLSAKNENIPFYISTTLLKYFPTSLPIELRSPDEVWKDRPAKLKILNLAFDKIPVNHIGFFITEYGLIKPADIKKTINHYYPWINDYAN